MALDDGPTPTPIALKVQTQEQAAALAAKILKESGLGNEMVNPASAKLIAHQILSEHVMETQKAEVERLGGELERLQRWVSAGRDGGDTTPPPPPPAVDPPRSQAAATPTAITSPSFPSAASAGAGPGTTAQSPAQAAHQWRASRALSGNCVTVPPVVAPPVVALSDPAQPLGIVAASPDAAQRQWSFGGHDGAVPPTSTPHPATSPPIFPPSADALGGDVGLAHGGVFQRDSTAGAGPPMSSMVKMPRPAGGGAPGATISSLPPSGAASEFDDKELTVTTAPPPYELSQSASLDSELDWNNVTKDVLAVVHDLTRQREAAEEERVALEMKLLEAAHSPRAVEDAVFDSPVRYPRATHDGSVFTLRAAGEADPLALEGPAGGDVPPPQALEAPPSATASTNGGGVPHAASKVLTPPLDADTPRESVPPAPTPPRLTDDHSAAAPAYARQVSSPPHPSQVQPAHALEDRHSSVSTHRSAVVGTMASPEGIVAVASPPPPAGALPDGWREYHTHAGRPYYYNTVTRKSHWRRPTQPAGKPLTINININVDKRKKRVGAEVAAAAGLDEHPSGASAARHVETIDHTQRESVAGGVSPPAGGHSPPSATVPPPSMGGDPDAAESSPSAAAADQAVLPSRASLTAGGPASVADAAAAEVEEVQAAEEPAMASPAAPAASGVPAVASGYHTQPSAGLSVGGASRHSSVRGGGGSVPRVNTVQSAASALPAAPQTSVAAAPPPAPAALAHVLDAPYCGVDARSGSPAIYPPVNSRTTVIVEDLDATGTPRVLVRGDVPQLAAGGVQDASSAPSPVPMRCVACGTTLNIGAAYCHSCGWRAAVPDVLSRHHA